MLMAEVDGELRQPLAAGDHQNTHQHLERTRTQRHRENGAATSRRFLTQLLNIYEKLQWLDATTLLSSRSTTAVPSHG